MGRVRHRAAVIDVIGATGAPGRRAGPRHPQFYRDFARELNITRDVARSRALNPALQSFDSWLAANASRIPLD